MTRNLETQMKLPVSGDVRSLVIFVHGYGANGADLLGLADPLGEHLPDTLFVSPDAPEQCIGSPMGYQWFPIPWIDGSSEEDAEKGLLSAMDDLNALINGLMDEYDLLSEQVALVGFSQGTMLSLHVAPRREEALAGVVGFSGRLLSAETLADDTQVRMPILLAHGDQDDVVPINALPEAVQALQDAEFKDVYAHVMEGTGHGIAPDGLGVALAFLRDQLGF